MGRWRAPGLRRHRTLRLDRSLRRRPFGGGVNLIDVTDPLGPALFGNPIRSPGPFAGLQAGYNYQSGIIVYGLEAEISFPQMEGTNTCSAVDAAIVNSTCRLNTDFIGNLAARLGVAVGPQGRGLVYGKTGVAWSTGSIDVATNDMLGGVLGNPVDDHECRSHPVGLDDRRRSRVRAVIQLVRQGRVRLHDLRRSRRHVAARPRTSTRPGRDRHRARAAGPSLARYPRDQDRA